MTSGLSLSSLWFLCSRLIKYRETWGMLSPLFTRLDTNYPTWRCQFSNCAHCTGPCHQLRSSFSRWEVGCSQLHSRVSASRRARMFCASCSYLAPPHFVKREGGGGDNRWSFLRDSITPSSLLTATVPSEGLREEQKTLPRRLQTGVSILWLRAAR